MIFELTFQDGTRLATETKDWGSFINNQNWAILQKANGGLVKIEQIIYRELQDARQAVNEAFHAYGKAGYHLMTDIMEFVVNTLEKHNFDSVPVRSGYFSRSDKGEIRGVPVGRETYLCVTWFKMPSGKYEFVGYVS